MKRTGADLADHGRSGDLLWHSRSCDVRIVAETAYPMLMSVRPVAVQVGTDGGGDGQLAVFDVRRVSGAGQRRGRDRRSRASRSRSRRIRPKSRSSRS